MEVSRFRNLQGCITVQLSRNFAVLFGDSFVRIPSKKVNVNTFFKIFLNYFFREINPPEYYIRGD